MVARRETPAVSAADVGERPARVAEADRREPRLGLLARELEARRRAAPPQPRAGAGRRAARAGRARAACVVCQSAMSSAALRREARGARASTRSSPRRAASGGCGGGVRAAGGARARAGSGSRARTPPPPRDRCSRARRGRRARGACRAAGPPRRSPVHELQQLHGELDVAQAAGAELELHVDLVGAGCARVTRSRMRCTDSTKPSRPELDHTFGATPAT